MPRLLRSTDGLQGLCGAQSPPESTPSYRSEFLIVQLFNSLLISIAQIWNTTHFEPSSLKALGLVMQLGHSLGTRCINPRPAPGDRFIILHTNGIHDVALNFCACPTAETDTVQLLRAGLYPATTQSPETAASIIALEFYHILTFESKASAFEFHNTLSRLTDNTGTIDVPVSPNLRQLQYCILTIFYRIDMQSFCAC